MKKSLVIVLAIVAVLAIWMISAYNKLVRGEETVNNAWAQVETAYQRRADLIPNLVATVKGYAAHESETLENVVRARGYGNSTEPTEDNVAAIQQQESAISSALSRLLMVVEAYPDLKANENFKDLQVQLEGTENRINEARNKFNAVVQQYNVVIRSFPKNILAGIFGFDKMAKFEADADAQSAPKVKF